jgi:prolyl-tRNA synthetase
MVQSTIFALSLIMWFRLLALASRSHVRALSVLPIRRRLVSVNSFRHRMPIATFSAATNLSEEQKSNLEAKIKIKGDEIRAIKEGGADKSAVAQLVEELKALKAQLAPRDGTSTSKPTDKKGESTRRSPDELDDEEESDFITARAVDYSRWYQDVIRVTGLAEPSPVRGCMVIKPWGMSLWDAMRIDLDRRIQEHGAENAYFPLLIPKSFLSKEAEHVEGFAKECAVVTHHRLTAAPDGSGLIADPQAELEDPLIIRPTSETMIWYMFRKWINSYR